MFAYLFSLRVFQLLTLVRFELIVKYFTAISRVLLTAEMNSRLIKTFSLSLSPNWRHLTASAVAQQYDY